MQNIKHKCLTILLPATILATLLMVLAGCVYVPWFPQHLGNGPDIHSQLGGADSNRPIRTGTATRADIYKWFGRPDYVSKDLNSNGYVQTRGHGFWVAPLCFEAVPAFTDDEIVKITFDKDGRVISFKWADQSRFSELFPEGLEQIDPFVNQQNGSNRPPTTR